jgi:Peptidase S46
MKNSVYIKMLVAAALSLGLVPSTSHSEEGMYTMDSSSGWPSEAMKTAGLEATPEKLLELSKAVAKVGVGAGGGSGSFVSDQGLLVTNHHVAYACIATLDGMAKHKGIVDKGYVAPSQKDEISCPGYALMIVDQVRDITADINEEVGPKLKGHKRFEATRLAKDKLEKECQKDGNICEADSLDGGRFHHMMVYRRILDVRLVYAPEKDIGKYGGDVDNWMYPRHTGDFSFLRAYVDKDGNGVGYNSDNVPFKPEVHLKVTNDGVKKNDFLAVIGFPARTKRNYPSASARFEVETAMPVRQDVYGGMIDVIHKVGAGDDLSARRYQGLEAGLNNAVKYYSQSSEGFAKWEVLEKRIAREKEIMEHLKKDPKAARQFKKVVKKIDRIYKKYSKAYKRHFMIIALARFARSIGVAYDIAKWTGERTKPDEMRKDAEYKEKNVYQIFGASDRLDDQVTSVADRALLIYVIEAANKLPKNEQIKSVRKLLKWGKKALKKVKKEARKAKKDFAEYYLELTGSTPSNNQIHTAVDLMFARTKLIAHSLDQDERDRALYQRRRMFYNPAKEAKRFRDPLLIFARGLAKEKEKVEKGPYRAIEETFDTELRPAYAKLIEAAYPDANFQVRMTYGKVDDYTATVDGKVHRYLTDGAGLLAKDKGEYPFNVPANLKQALTSEERGRFIDAEIGDVPINFTSTLDTTGGNSGSPVLDGKGQLIGLLFDGTPESILSDWQFLPDEQRSICLDIRYALFLAEKVHNATHLLKEMGL